MHGMFIGQEHLDFKRLQAIHEKVKSPLVLHGASGVEHNEIKKAVNLGIKIINIDTYLRKVFTEKLQQTLQAKKEEIDPRNVLSPSINAVQKAVEEKIKIFGSTGKA